MIRHPEISLNYATLYWISAVMVFCSTVHCGAARLILPKFDAEQFLAKVKEYKVTYTFMQPLQTYSLTNLENPEKYDVSSLHILTVAGSSISPDQLLKTKKMFKHTRVMVAYGSTEAGNFICYNESKESENDLKSIGRPLNDMEMKVVDPDTGKILGPNQNGELRYKSPYIMTGYCNMDSSPYFDEDGFVKSGDLGFYNDHKCFYITGRIKEMFKYKTWHVVPTFIESILMEHPAVLEAAVFGLPHEVDGFHPAACITLRNGESLDVDDLQRFIDDNVSEWQRLRGGIKVVDSFPKTATSKIQKAGLFELFMKS
ncbi:hypothetical protein JTB14_001319 [Gonioctena quinquepunctata]|nr:hypothetical protein JTB14_001319 [Gonioctena quinquepunctata]